MEIVASIIRTVSCVNIIWCSCANFVFDFVILYIVIGSGY